MKFFTALFFLLPFLLSAQTDGSRAYAYKMYLVKKEAPPDSDPEMREYLGYDRMDTIYYTLLANGKHGTFKADLRISNHQGGGLDLGEILIRSHGEYYYDFKDSLVYNHKVTGGKRFTIKEDFSSLEWEFTEEEEIINGLKSRKAVRTKDDQGREFKTIVWYSETVPAEAMPFGLTGVPGGIVKITFNNFAEVILGKIGPSRKKIKPMKFGEVVTQEEYDEITEKNVRSRRESRDGVDKD